MPIVMVQKFVVEVNSAKLLEQYLRFAITTALKSHEEVAVKVINRKKKHLNLHLPSTLMDQTKHFPVIFIDGWYSPKKGAQNSYFNGYGPWTTFRSVGTTSAVDAAIQHIKELFEKHGKVWEAQFKKRFDNGFTPFDGSIGLGYELRACGCFPEQLAISIVNMYYGK